MHFDVPQYVVERIRESPPYDACVVPGSTPVIAFGSVRGARVATLGLNPSRQEFLDTHSRELTGHQRRFETLASLGIEDRSALTDEHVHRVLATCHAYFQRNPYRRWFDQLEAVLGSIGVSYYNGTACHLDLVQWATDPTWQKLPKRAQQHLMVRDREFFRRQLMQEEDIHILLLNGTAVVSAFEDVFHCGVEEYDVLRVDRQPTRIVVGRLCNRVLIVGWNINLQSSFGVSNELRGQLAAAVAGTCRAMQGT